MWPGNYAFVILLSWVVPLSSVDTILRIRFAAEPNQIAESSLILFRVLCVLCGGNSQTTLKRATTLSWRSRRAQPLEPIGG